MRRIARRRSGLEFGGSGEDSFVAVVVTKLTGALLFILLLTMVIMALLPKAVDMVPASDDRQPGADGSRPSRWRSRPPRSLPEAIAGRPYAIALAATGGRGPLRWAIDGQAAGRPDVRSGDRGAPGHSAKGTPEPLALAVRVSDGTEIATHPCTGSSIYQSDKPLTTPPGGSPGSPADPLAGLARSGRRFPGPLARPPGRHEHPGEPGTEGGGRCAASRVGGA